MKRKELLHVVPSGKGHVSRRDCWCWPYEDPGCKGVWIHRDNRA